VFLVTFHLRVKYAVFCEFRSCGVEGTKGDTGWMKCSSRENSSGYRHSCHDVDRLELRSKMKRIKEDMLGCRSIRDDIKLQLQQ